MQYYHWLILTGARIDHAHHANGARVALEETLAMEEAVARATELVDDRDTLIIVTADHAHALNIGSYSTRGNSILGRKLSAISETKILHKGKKTIVFVQC